MFIGLFTRISFFTISFDRTDAVSAGRLWLGIPRTTYFGSVELRIFYVVRRNWLLAAMMSGQINTKGQRVKEPEWTKYFLSPSSLDPLAL
jgi:hypothetical protein